MTLYKHYPSNYPNANIIAVASITSAGSYRHSPTMAQQRSISAPPVPAFITTAFNLYSMYNGTSMATPA